MCFLNSVFEKLIMCISDSLHKLKDSLNINARILFDREGSMS
jgi:hypothetical protein